MNSGNALLKISSIKYPNVSMVTSKVTICCPAPYVCAGGFARLEVSPFPKSQLYENPAPPSAEESGAKVIVAGSHKELWVLLKQPPAVWQGNTTNILLKVVFMRSMVRIIKNF